MSVISLLPTPSIGRPHVDSPLLTFITPGASLWTVSCSHPVPGHHPWAARCPRTTPSPYQGSICD
eukprot:1373173-Pyramimonas_sp.AAC.1